MQKGNQMEESKKDVWNFFWLVVIVTLVFLSVVEIGMSRDHQSRCEEGYERVHVGNTSGCISYETILKEIK